jgi:glycosyltransferase involved in cell wall biosynthesis
LQPGMLAFWKNLMSHAVVCVFSYDRDRPGGSFRLTDDLARGLVARGHRVTVVCEDVGDRGEVEVQEDGIVVLRYRLRASHRLHPGRHMDHVAATIDLLRRKVTELPDIVHGHSLFQYVAALRLYGESARCCYSIHSPVVDELKIVWGAQGVPGFVKRWLGLPIIRKLEYECLRGSNILTAESNYTRELIAQQYGSEAADRINVIPGWVDTHRFQPLRTEDVQLTRRRLGWPVERPVLFALRRLEARMGLDNLLRALRIVKRRGYDVLTAIGGKGSQLARLVALRSSLGLEDDVVFHGVLPASDVPLAFGACDASVVPTAHLECFGLIALEAMACGRTTLVTPVGALPEVVGDLEPGWVAAGKKPDLLADLICSFLDGRLPSHPVSTLRDYLQRRYTFETALAKYEGLFFSERHAARPSSSPTFRPSQLAPSRAGSKGL